MKLDQELINVAIELMHTRFPNAGGLAAAAYTADGDIYTSVVFDPEWGGGGLCAETGALLNIHKDNKQLTAMILMTILRIPKFALGGRWAIYQLNPFELVAWRICSRLRSNV